MFLAEASDACDFSCFIKSPDTDFLVHGVVVNSAVAVNGTAVAVTENVTKIELG